MTISSGSVVGDRFEVIDVAATGGMGSVCRARDGTTGALVALKVMRSEDEKGAKRLLREGDALARLDHPNVVRHVAHGLTANGQPYVAMEYIEGETLAKRIARSVLTYAEVLELAKGISAALGHVHDHGIVHRDVKPGNLILRREMRDVVLVDFGVARLQTIHDITEAGITVGTPAYMSPEQARGYRDLTPASDVFALGSVLYRALAGSPPFSGNDPLAILGKVLFEDPVPLETIAAVDPRMAQLVRRMLQKDPSLRPHDGHEVARVLRDLADARPSAPPPPSQRVPGIGIAELSLVSAVVVGPPRADETRPVLPEDIAQDHGITMSKLLGGARIAVLSGQGFATDKAARAVRLAIALSEMLPLAPIGVATGRAIVGARLPVGEAIDRASQLLAGGAPSVRVDAVTAALLDARWDVSQKGDAWTVTPSAEPHGSVRTLLGKPTSFVGREREIGTLDALFEECAGEPQAHAVLLAGAPGFGKTRLLTEWLRSVREKNIEVWTSAGDPSRAGSPLEIVAQHLRSAASLRLGEAIDIAQFKLLERVERSRHPERERLAEFMGEIVHTPFDDQASPRLVAARRDPQLMAEQTLRAWIDFVEAETALGPRVLVIEDLHWGDAPSVRLIDAALRVCRRRALFVIATARPTVDDVHPKLWAERSIHRIPVGELGRRASEKLVRDVLGSEVPEDVVQRAVEHSAGHALLLEEILRAQSEGRAKGDTVLAIVQSRLDGLPDHTRRVLRTGSIFGTTFWQGGIARLLGIDPAAALDDLVERELIVHAGARRFANEKEYAFRHALVSDAAYASLLDRDRALGHRVAGEWLAHVGERDASVLAEHFERGGARDRARSEWQRAAEQALDGGDFSGAISRAERAIVCGAEGPELAELRVLQTEAHLWRGSIGEARAASEVVLAIVAPGSRAWFRAVGATITVVSRTMENERIEQLAELLVKTAPVTGAELDRGMAASRLLTVIVLSGSKHPVDEVSRISEEALAQFPDDPILPALALFARAMLAKRGGDVMGLVSEMDACRVAAERSGNEKVVGVALANLADSWTHLGHYEKAEACARQSLGICERLGLALYTTLARHNLSLALTRSGDLSLARSFAEEARRGFEQVGAGRLACYSRVYMADILRRMAELEAAEREVRLALAIAETPMVRATVLGALARTLLTRNDAQGSLEAAREGMEILDAQGRLDEGEMTLRLAYFEAARACGRDVSDAARETQARLTKLAEGLPVEHRRAFLERIEEHRDIIALAQRRE